MPNPSTVKVSPAKTFRNAGLAILALLVIFVVFRSWYTIAAGHRGILLVWGKATKQAITPGFHLKSPIGVDVMPMSVRVQKYSEPQTAASKDLQNVTTTVSLNFSIIPDRVPQLYMNVGTISTLEAKILAPVVANAVKAVTAQYNAEDLVVKRDEVAAKIETMVRSALQPYNINVQAVNITNFAFSHEYATAIENKQVAQQKSLQAKYELTRAQIDAQKQVAIAKANAESTILNAKADAKALELKRKAVTQELIMLKAVSKWNGKLPDTLVTSGKGGFLLNLPATVTKGAERGASGR